MLDVGRIISVPEARGIDRAAWVALISAHHCLAPVPARPGVNPFTREPMVFRAPDTEAIVCIGGAEVGFIGWAMDGSPMLIVRADDRSVERVVAMAQEIATALGGRLVREEDNK